MRSMSHVTRRLSGGSCYPLGLLFSLSALVLLTEAGQAQSPGQQAPTPPAIVYPSAPEVQHGDSPAVAEPSNPSGVRGRSNTTVLIENGENGAGSVEDNTGSGYDLLQNSVSAQGDYAFHLATEAGDWFKPTSTVTVTPGCKLFFQSRLGWATSDQTARVQISTNAGATWSSTVWTQSGTGGSGESGFSLQEVNLSAFDGQSIQVRFLYDFNFGSFFPQSESGVGWYVDNIQIGSAFSKDLYTQFGDPSDDEQHYLEYINRARANAAVEAARLRDESDPLITSEYSAWGVAGNDIINQFAWHVSAGCMDGSAQPLAFNTQLLQLAKLHTQDLFDNMFQGHVSSNSPPAPFLPGDTLGDRLARVGYSGGAGENVFSYSKSVAHGHAGFDVDWGNTTNFGSSCYNAAFAGQGMQNPPGHRLSIHNGAFREVGIGVINGTNGSVGPQLVTQNFGTGGSRVITGVVYVDSNNNSFYDPGEGVSGVRVETPGSAFFSVTSSSGGYAIPVDTDGAHPVTFSEGGVLTSTLNAVVAGGNNTKLDYLPASVTTTLLGDVNLDGMVDFLDISSFIGALSAGPYQVEADCNEDGVVNFSDIASFIQILTGV